MYTVSLYTTTGTKPLSPGFTSNINTMVVEPLIWALVSVAPDHSAILWFGTYTPRSVALVNIGRFTVWYRLILQFPGYKFWNNRSFYKGVTLVD